LQRKSKRRLIVVAAAAAVIPVVALTVSSGASASPGKVAVAQGIGPSVLKDASPFGSVPSDTPEQVSFILRDRNVDGLKAAVEGGYQPTLSVSDFAAQYGQTSDVISGLESYLKGFGISITTTYADGLDISTTGTAGDYDSALTVQQQWYHVPPQGGLPGQTIHGTKQTPDLPGSFGGAVLAVLGLTNYSPFSDNLKHVPAGTQVSNTVTSQTSGVNTGNLTPADFESNYNLTPLVKDGITGQGETLAIVTLAALSVGAPEDFWSNVLHIATAPDRVDVVNVDGGPGAPNEDAGSGETDLDVEQSGAIAPDASIIVYQAPNTDPGFADAFYQAASDNTADTVSTSWGESETIIAASVATGVETPAYLAAFDQAFLEMSAQKQSMFVASGDDGAYDASGDIGTTNLSVDTPGVSPFVTDAGGTTLGGQIDETVNLPTGPIVLKATIPAQRTWGWDWLWPDWAQWGATSETAFAESQVGGGGGGYSTDESVPSYQRDVSGLGSYRDVEYLTPTDYTTTDGLSLPTEWSFNPAPSVASGYAGGRAVPDVAADADPFTGYLLYDPLQSPTLEGGWGGTSFVAPQMNGSTALIDQYVGHRVGLWNPQIYRFATSGNDPFTPLDNSSTSNDNLYYTGTPGAVYNPGSGLGTPNLAQLAYDFAK
jgi:subtilase family serine protease